MLCFVAVLVIEYKGVRKRTKEYRELEHFAEFLSNLKDQFYLCKNVTESIFRAAERVPGGLRKRLEEICFLLEEDAMGTTVAEEHYPRHLKYVRLFWIQCRSAVRYGSGRNGAESVFVKNMTELRRDVQNECYQRAQSMYLFAGMGIIVGMPVLFLPLIQWFGSVTMEELGAFYEGKIGGIIVAIFGGITICCYGLLHIVRQSDKRLYQRPELLEFFFSGIVLGKVFECFKGSKAEQMGERRLKAAGIDANGMQYWIVCSIIGSCVAIFMFLLFRDAQFVGRFLAIGSGFVIGNGIGMGFYKYLAYLRRLGMSGEVLGLQSVVLLVIDVPNITIMGVLDVLGTCGELFRKKLLRCADEYASEDVRALERMFVEESNPEFRRLAGRILASERIGLKAAFSEIASDRNFFREQLRLDMEQELKKKAANAQIVAFLPMMFLLFAYLILPFLGISLKQMGEIFKEMEQIRYF